MRRLGLVMAAVLAIQGCGKSGKEVPTPEVPAPVVVGPPPRFRAQELPFTYDRGESGLALPPETTGGGVAMIDADGDGDLDLFFPQGTSLEENPTAPPRADCLLRNLGGGRFADVSAESGLVPKGYGQGVAAADYDGDGDTDLYVTRYGTNTLWRNDRGRFTDATEEAGVGCPLWSMGAAFFDADGDGDLDLFVANYVEFNRKNAPFGRDAEGKPRYGTPWQWEGQPDVLYRNDGDGHFTDVTDRAGIAGAGRGMGVVAADFDGDGRMDVLVANDAEANALWRNRGDGTFEDVAIEWGVAFNGDGHAEANMGIARGDANGDGMPDLLITHLFGEHTTLWARVAGKSFVMFEDQTPRANLIPATRPLTGWGIALRDFNADGNPDLLMANGHVRPEPDQAYEWKCPAKMMIGSAGARFEDVSASAGPYFQVPHLGRGLAVGDLDDDGDLDAVVVHYGEPSVILWNETKPHGRLVRFDLVGAAPNRDAIGAVLTAKAGPRRFVRAVDGGGGYLSVDDRRITIGVGSIPVLDEVTVRWPSGRTEARRGIAATGTVRWVEASGSGPVTASPGSRRSP